MQYDLLSILSLAALCVAGTGVVAQSPLISSAVVVNGLIGDVAVDEEGNAYVTGSFDNSMTLGTTTLYSGIGNGSEGFIAKLSPVGEWLWAKRFGSASEGDIGLAVATGQDGDLAVAAVGLAAWLAMGLPWRPALALHRQ